MHNMHKWASIDMLQNLDVKEGWNKTFLLYLFYGYDKCCFFLAHPARHKQFFYFLTFEAKILNRKKSCNYGSWFDLMSVTKA